MAVCFYFVFIYLFSFGDVCALNLFYFIFRVFVSGFSDGDQSSGADPHKAAVAETVVQGADQPHPLGGAGRRLAVSVAGLWANAPARRALLSDVLVQL